MLTDAQVVKRFGDPTPHLRIDGSVRDTWGTEILEMIELPDRLPLSWNQETKVIRFRAHRKIGDVLLATFIQIHDDGYWPLLKDFGGCYCWREMRKAAKLSRHCWGIAVDLNVNDNPFRGTPSMPPEIVAIFEAHDFEWGGNWKRRKDGMHFEYAGDIE